MGPAESSPEDIEQQRESRCSGSAMASLPTLQLEQQPKFNNNSIPYQQIVDAKFCRSMAPRRFFPSVAQVSTLHRLAAELSVGEKRCFAYLSGWAGAAIECGLPLGPVKV